MQAPRRRVALVVALAATALAFWLPFALRTTWAVGLPLVVPAWLWFGSTSGSALRVVFRDEDPSALLAAAATVITGLAAGMMLSVLSPVGEDGYFIFDLVGIWTLPLTVPYFIGAVTNRGRVRKTILFVAIVSSLVWGALAAVLVDAGAGAEASSGRVLAGILTMSLSPLAILALFALRVPHIGHRGNVGPRHGTAATLVILLLSASLPASGTHIARAEGETQLLHSSYVGGEYDDFSQAIAVDGAGNFWVGGTGDDLFPATDSNNGDGPSFVRKYDKNGVPLFTNYFLGVQPNPGRSYMDWIGGIAVDAQGNAYIAGSADERFPATVRPPQPCPEDDRTVFLMKMSPTGNIIYSTMLCGGGGFSPAHAARGVAVDTSGNAYVVGYTASEHFTTTSGALIRTIPSDKPGSHYNDTGFVAKFGANGSLVYSTYLGGGTADRAWAVAADAAGNAYVTGETFSMDFPIVGGLGRPWYNTDAFVAKLNPSGSALVYSTFLGGLGFDNGFGIDVDASGSAYIVGRTASGAPEIPDGYRFPVTAGAAQVSPGTQGLLVHDGFVAKLNPAGNALVYATYIGGNGDDETQAVSVDSAGNAWVTGYTTSSNFPMAGATQASLHGHSDAFVTKLSPSGNAFLFSTYHGGSGAENDEQTIYVKQYTRSGIAVDAAGTAYVTGYTDSTDFPLKAAYQDKNYGSSPGKMQDAFVAIFGAAPAPPRPEMPYRVVIPFVTRN